MPHNPNSDPNTDPRFGGHVKGLMDTFKKDLKKALCPDEKFVAFFEDVFEEAPGEALRSTRRLF